MQSIPEQEPSLFLHRREEDIAQTNRSEFRLREYPTSQNQASGSEPMKRLCPSNRIHR